MADTNFEYKTLIGVSNKKDPKRILPGYLAYAANVDSDDEKKLHRRRGRTLESSTSTHSIWSNKDICLCVQGGVLKEVVIDFNVKTATYTTILENVGNSAMVFQESGDDIFFSSDDVFGYIRERTAHGIPNITQTYKDRMTGGHMMEYWDSRLWVFQDKILLYSDATMPFVRDERHNFISFNGRGRMLKAVKNGLYVSDTKRCGFLHGGTGDPPKFDYFEVSEYPAIEGMVSSKVEMIRGVSVKVVYWVSEDGCYMGLPGGEVTRITKDHFVLKGVAKGKTMCLTRTFNDRDEVDQFMGVYDFEPGYGGMELNLTVPAIEVSGRLALL